MLTVLMWILLIFLPRQTFTPSALASHVGSAGDLLHRTTAKTMEVLTTTGMTTKAVLSAVGDHRWWKESLSYLRPLQVRTPIVCVCVSVLNWPASQQMWRFPGQSRLNKPVWLTQRLQLPCRSASADQLQNTCFSVSTHFLIALKPSLEP